MKEKTLLANTVVLRQIRRLVETIDAKRINMATYWAEPLGHSGPPAGCLLGHYVRSGKHPAISLKPINFLGELKSPVMADALLDQYPLRYWRHYTLHYEERTVEAFGLSAAILLLRLKKWDLHMLFYPAGSSYEIRPPLSHILLRLDRYIRSIPDVHPAQSRARDPEVAADS